MTKTDSLARRITRKSSLQTYLTIMILADRSLVNDAYKAYAYFRWVDDQVDIYLNTQQDRIKFIKRQKLIISASYGGKKLPNLALEEQMAYDLISSDIEPDSKLRSYIYKFISIIEFDAKRKNKLINEKDINWYSQTIGIAVTDCIQYFMRQDTSNFQAEDQYKAAIAAHIVHMLRDFKDDLSEGFVNVPKEYLDKNNIKELNYKDIRFSGWIKNRISLAQSYFKDGKTYIYKMPASRCKLTALMYCLRFEPLLAILNYKNYKPHQSYLSGMNINPIKT